MKEMIKTIDTKAARLATKYEQFCDELAWQVKYHWVVFKYEYLGKPYEW